MKIHKLVVSKIMTVLSLISLFLLAGFFWFGGSSCPIQNGFRSSDCLAIVDYVTVSLCVFFLLVFLFSAYLQLKEIKTKQINKMLRINMHIVTVLIGAVFV